MKLFLHIIAPVPISFRQRLATRLVDKLYCSIGAALRQGAELCDPYPNHLILGETIMEMINNFMQEEDGVTAIEYGLIAALIAVVIIASVQGVGTALVKVFTKVSSSLAAVVP